MLGILYDSVSDNTGDKAIGIALEQYLKSKKINFHNVSPYADNIQDYPLLIIGGGYILRPEGDLFYDAFRPKGRHILNAPGVMDGEYDFLNNYAYVTARSKREVKILQEFTSNHVECVPCMTINLETDESPEDMAIGAVGIHLVPDTIISCPGIEIEILMSVAEKKVLLPFTHYNYDKNFMLSLPWDSNSVEVLTRTEPLQLLASMKKMKYVIVSSLHATIFAYSNNIPFITYGQPKVEDFLKDRGLERFMFKDIDSFRQALNHVKKDRPDFSENIKEDKKILAKHLKRIEEEIQKISNLDSDIELQKTSRCDKQKFDNQLLQQVVLGRDRLIADISGRLRTAVDENIILNAKLNESTSKEQQKNDHGNRIKSLLNIKKHR